jgi:SynChlorMet cassette protein ScmC
MSLVVPAADGIWQAHPLPTWSAIKAGEATWPCRINIGIPVAAIFFLIRSETDGVERLGRGVSAIGIKDNASICFHYLDRYFHEAHHRPLRRKIFENAALLTAHLPVYALRASLQGRFWEKIEEVLGQVRQLWRRRSRQSMGNSKTEVVFDAHGSIPDSESLC